MHSLLTVVFCLALAAEPAADITPDGPPAEERPGNLDDDLLRGLEDDPLDEPVETESTAEDAPAEPGQEAIPHADPLDQELFRDLEQGEDVGAEEEDPLARLGRRMREVEERIAAAKSGEETQELQREILADIRELIKQALQQQQQSQASQSRNQRTRKVTARVQVRQVKPQPGTTSARPSSRPAQDSGEELRPDETQRPDMNAMNDMAKRLWGHLPEKDREAMLQRHMEEFLPEYELLISEYFKALVERQEE